MANFTNASINISSSGSNSIISAVASAKIRIRRLVIANGVATAQVVTVQDGSNTLAILTLPSSIGGGYALSDDPNFAPLWVCSTNSAFQLSLSAATGVTGFVSYTIE